MSTRRERLERKLDKRRAREATEAGGVRLVVVPSKSWGGDWARLTFEDKPERETLAALRECGYHWGAGSWTGAADKLPQVLELVERDAHTAGQPGTLETALCDRIREVAK